MFRSFPSADNDSLLKASMQLVGGRETGLISSSFWVFSLLSLHQLFLLLMPTSHANFSYHLGILQDGNAPT